MLPKIYLPKDLLSWSTCVPMTRFSIHQWACVSCCTHLVSVICSASEHGSNVVSMWGVYWASMYVPMFNVWLILHLDLNVLVLRMWGTGFGLNSKFFFVGCDISRCLSTTPHPINRARGSILLVHCSMIILMTAILGFFMAIVRYDHSLIYCSPSRVWIRFQE